MEHRYRVTICTSDQVVLDEKALFKSLTEVIAEHIDAANTIGLAAGGYKIDIYKGGCKKHLLPNETSEFWTETIFSIIETKPGLSKQQILAQLEDENGDPKIAYWVLTNCLTTLRRRGSIENRGTRKYPKWYKIET